MATTVYNEHYTHSQDTRNNALRTFTDRERDGRERRKKIALTKNTSTEPKSNEMRIAYACTFGLLDFVLNRAQQPNWRM